MSDEPSALEALRSAWGARWPEALATWSPYTKLAQPRLCITEAEEQEERLQGSFAMIRVADHAVVIGLVRWPRRDLQRFRCKSSPMRSATTSSPQVTSPTTPA